MFLSLPSFNNSNTNYSTFCTFAGNICPKPCSAIITIANGYFSLSSELKCLFAKKKTKKREQRVKNLTHTSLWQKHARTHARTQCPYASSLGWIVGPSPFCPFSRLMWVEYLTFDTVVVWVTPHSCLCSTYVKKMTKKKITSACVFGGGGLSEEKPYYYFSWKLGHSGRGGASLGWNADSSLHTWGDENCTRLLAASTRRCLSIRVSGLCKVITLLAPDLTSLERRSHSLV